MSKHATKRALEYYGLPLSWADQGALLERIDRGGGARIREQHKDKLPIYFINWPRIAQTIAVVVNEQRRRIVTVLPPNCGEVAWRIQKLFGKPYESYAGYESYESYESYDPTSPSSKGQTE